MPQHTENTNLDLALTLVLVKDERSGRVIAFIKEIPGAVSDGIDKKDALKSLSLGMKAVAMSVSRLSAADLHEKSKDNFETTTIAVPFNLPLELA